jgi:hypothetical protein
MKRVGCLDGLNGGGWGVFIAPTTILVVGSLLCRWAQRIVQWCTGHSTVHYLVRAMLADRWGLELLTVEDFCPFGAPDSPVWSGIADCLLTSDGQTVAQSTVGKIDCCFMGLPDCPVIFSGQEPRILESDQFAECSSQGTGHCSVHTGQSGAPLVAANLFAPNLKNCPAVIFLYVYMNFMHPRKY